MKRLFWAAAIAFLCAATYNGGAIHEADRIQATCEADSGSTVINGEHYLCLSQRQIDILRRERARNNNGDV